MKEKAASITAQRERKTEAGANAISTFICHASEELKTSLAPELWLPAASPRPGEPLGGTRALDPFEGTGWCVATCACGAVGRSLPLNPALPALAPSQRAPKAPAGRPWRFSSAPWCRSEQGCQWGLQHLPPAVGRGRAALSSLVFILFFIYTGSSAQRTRQLE